jgi:hypothetical protein
LKGGGGGPPAPIDITAINIAEDEFKKLLSFYPVINEVNE